MIFRRLVRTVGWSLLGRQAPEWVPHDLAGSTVVFSPHYDDETLGAGAAILRLRQLEVPVRIVFMTDGSRSHAGAISEGDLSALRREEGIRAAAVLGVEAGFVTCLEYPETRLALHRDEAVRRVAELLVQFDCRRVFVPSSLEPEIWSEDHRATTEIVFAAMTLARGGQSCEVMEYLIWFWYHWPWVPVVGTGDARQLLKLTWQNAFGLRARGAVNTSVSLAALRAKKLEALEQHRTQMTRIATDKPWPVLADVAQGEFLENFFRSREWFRSGRWEADAEAIRHTDSPATGRHHFPRARRD